MGKRMKHLLLMFAGLTVFLVGCGSGGGSEAGSSESGDGAVELTVWLTPQWQGVFDSGEEGADYDSFFNYAAERFEEEYTEHDVNINVEVIASDQRDELLNVNLNGGTPPDIIFESTFALGDYVHRGALVPLTDTVDEESKEDIAETYWDQVTFGDDVYFYPFSHNPGTWVYNADMFADAGLDQYVGEKEEIVTWTLEETEEILNTLKSDLPEDKYTNAFPMGLFALNNQGDTWNLAYLRMFGNEIFNENGEIVLNDASGAQALEWLQTVHADELSNPGPESVSSNDVSAMFQNQQLGIGFTNSILYNNMLADMASDRVDAFDARLANIPTADGGASEFTYIIGSGVFDTGDATRTQVAKDFVKFYSTDQELIDASKNGVPVRTSVTEKFSSENPLFAAYEENAQYLFNFSGNVPGYNELRQVLYPELQALYTGSKTPEQAAADYQENGNAVIENAKSESVIYSEE